MSNTAFTIAVPAAIGVGAGVDVSSISAEFRQYQYNSLLAADQVKIQGSKNNVDWSDIVHSDGSLVTFNGSNPPVQQTNDRSLYVRAKRTAGSGVATCYVTGAEGSATGLGDQNPTPLTLLQRTATGAGLLTSATLGAVGAVVSATGLIKVTGAAETVIGADAIGGAGDLVLLSKDGADGATIGDPTNFQGLVITSKTGANPSPLTVNAIASGGVVVSFINGTVAASRRVQIAMGSAANNWSIFVDPAAAGVQKFAIIDNAAALTRFQIDASGRIAVGNTAADASSILDLQSTAGGFFAPRMTSAQFLAINTNAPARGILAMVSDQDTTGQLVVNVGSGANPAKAVVGTQHGRLTLVAGTTALIPAHISATSSITLTVGTSTPGAGNLTVFYAALIADRVVGESGAGGGFKATALIAAGTINVLDLSILDWTITG